MWGRGYYFDRNAVVSFLVIIFDIFGRKGIAVNMSVYWIGPVPRQPSLFVPETYAISFTMTNVP